MDTSLSFVLKLHGKTVNLSICMGPDHKAFSSIDLPFNGLRDEIIRLTRKVIADLVDINKELEKHEMVEKLKANLQKLERT